MKKLDELKEHCRSLVGKSVATPNGQFRGECVSLIQDVLYFLGGVQIVPRGNANVFVENLRKQYGFERSGKVNIISSAYGKYGHIWIQVDGKFYEQNGKSPRKVSATRSTEQFENNRCTIDSLIDFSNPVWYNNDMISILKTPVAADGERHLIKVVEDSAGARLTNLAPWHASAAAKGYGIDIKNFEDWDEMHQFFFPIYSGKRINGEGKPLTWDDRNAATSWIGEDEFQITYR